MERSRISVGDRVLIIEGMYTGCHGTVCSFDPTERAVTVRLENLTESSVKLSVEKLEGNGWKEIGYPVSRANDPIDW